MSRLTQAINDLRVQGLYKIARFKGIKCDESVIHRLVGQMGDSEIMSALKKRSNFSWSGFLKVLTAAYKRRVE